MFSLKTHRGSVTLLKKRFPVLCLTRGTRGGGLCVTQTPRIPASQKELLVLLVLVRGLRGL